MKLQKKKTANLRQNCGSYTQHITTIPITIHTHVILRTQTTLKTNYYLLIQYVYIYWIKKSFKILNLCVSWHGNNNKYYIQIKLAKNKK